MNTPQKPQKAYLFVDYIPAELRENKTWKIVYYVKNPLNNKLSRKENRVKPLKSIALRRKLGKQMVDITNKKLESGWNPFLSETESNGFVKLHKAIDTFINKIKKQVQLKELRPDTLRSYKSFLNNIIKYNKELNNEDIITLKFNNDYVREFLDYIYYTRENSSKTRNNYLSFIRTFSEWLIINKYIASNPTHRINKIQESKKSRQLIPKIVRNKIFEHLKKTNYNYYVICLIVYYCLIRRTELTKIRVSDVFIKNAIIYIEAGNAKNKKSQPITIPDTILPIIANFIKNANNSDYLFGVNFTPGQKRLAPKKISDQWAKLRIELNLPKTYQWYSLKDTGITNLLKAGIPPIEVRNQARHHSIIQTEMYTPKEILKAVDSIKTAKI